MQDRLVRYAASFGELAGVRHVRDVMWGNVDSGTIAQAGVVRQPKPASEDQLSDTLGLRRPAGMPFTPWPPAGGLVTPTTSRSGSSASRRWGNFSTTTTTSALRRRRSPPGRRVGTAQPAGSATTHCALRLVAVTRAHLGCICQAGMVGSRRTCCGITRGSVRPCSHSPMPDRTGKHNGNLP
jgi:hypothetical protein